MSDGSTPDPVSRRTMLKRVGAAGAIVWVTPVISSLTTPAYAATSFVQCTQTCVHCEDNDNLCGRSGPFNRCFCTPPADGSPCFCGEEIDCSQTHPCGVGAADCSDLGPDWICSDVCGCGGGQFCIPPCGHNTGTNRSATAHGETTAGRRL